MKVSIIIDRLSKKHNAFTQNECYQVQEILKHKQDELQAADSPLLSSLLDVFSQAYWDSDATLDEQGLLDIFRNITNEKKCELIKSLLAAYKKYPKFITWAKELLISLPQEYQQKIKCYPIKVTKEDIGTFIKQAEYKYRLRHGLKCFRYKGEYCRPTQKEDFQYFYDSLDMAYHTGQPTYTYLG